MSSADAGAAISFESRSELSLTSPRGRCLGSCLSNVLWWPGRMATFQFTPALASGFGLLTVQQAVGLHHIDEAARRARTVCTRPESASVPMFAFMPYYHGLPFLLWFISGLRSPEAFLGGARHSDRCGIHHRAALEQQALLGQDGVDGCHDLRAHLLSF